MIIITGPTGSGKTDLGIKLAKEINGEIISADSRQVYKYLKVGTSKPDGIWKNGKYYVNNIPHHLIDILSPDTVFSTGDFVRLSKSIITDIEKNNKIPIIVGGTGLYIRSLIEGLTKLPPRNNEIRMKLNQLVENFGKEYLYNLLYNIDKEKAEQIHPNNISRIIRALEVYYLTGKPISRLYKEELKDGLNNRNICYFSILYPRDVLYKHIESRVIYMLNNGMIEETINLLSKGFSENCPALQSLGYKYVIQFINKKINYSEMQQYITRDTKHYIKRQMTWFKKEKNINWIDYKLILDDTKNKAIDFILNKFYGKSYCSCNKIS